jgi:solute carrier family 35 protein E3
MDSANVKTLTIILGWFGANVTTVILNKHIFQNLGWMFPVSLTIVHMVTCLIGSLLVLKVFRFTPFVNLTWQEWVKGVLPLRYAVNVEVVFSDLFQRENRNLTHIMVNLYVNSFVFCFNIVLGNVSLRYVPVSFMQTVKSSVPFFTVMLETLWLRVDQKDNRIFQSLVPIVGGVVLASWTEQEFEMTGFLAALFASVVTALLSILTSKLLQTSLNSPNLMYYMAPLSAGMLIPIASVSETTGLSVDLESRSSITALLITLTISGLVAFALNTLTFLLINNTSALTYTVVGNVKVVFSIIFSVMILGNKVGIGNAVGCLITLAGAAWYSQVKYQIKTASSPALPR